MNPVIHPARSSYEAMDSNPIRYADPLGDNVPYMPPTSFLNSGASQVTQVATKGGSIGMSVARATINQFGGLSHNYSNNPNMGGGGKGDPPPGGKEIQSSPEAPITNKSGWSYSNENDVYTYQFNTFSFYGESPSIFEIIGKAVTSFEARMNESIKFNRVSSKVRKFESGLKVYKTGVSLKGRAGTGGTAYEAKVSAGQSKNYGNGDYTNEYNTDLDLVPSNSPFTFDLTLTIDIEIPGKNTSNFYEEANSKAIMIEPVFETSNSKTIGRRIISTGFRISLGSKKKRKRRQKRSN